MSSQPPCRGCGCNVDASWVRDTAGNYWCDECDDKASIFYAEHGDPAAGASRPLIPSAPLQLESLEGVMQTVTFDDKAIRLQL